MGVTADPMVPRFATVTRTERETHDTVTLTLDAAPWDGEFAFAPGQFNMLYVFGVGEIAVSISGDPARTDRIVHTVRGVGSVSKKIEALAKGATIGVRGPFGAPWPVEAARGRDAVVMAGGLGLAPLRPVIYRLMALEDEVERVFVLVGARAPEELCFAKELERWRERLDVRVIVDRAGPDWTGDVGVVTALLDKVTLDGPNAVAFACGPETMMRFSARALEEKGVARERIHLSLERNMKCAVGFCGHCQLGPAFICRDGPVLDWGRVAPLLATREL